MLENLDRWAVVAHLVKEMRANNGWAGETHIQKTIFFTQELLQVPCGYHFVLYKHGPYSFDLHDDLGSMLTNSILGLELRPPYGPSFGIHDIGNGIILQRSQIVRQYNERCEFIVNTLSTRDVRELERLGTALLLRKENSSVDQATLASKIVECKPHVTINLALDAVQEVAQIEKAAKGAGLLDQ